MPNFMPDPHADRLIYSVSRLNREVGELLSRGLGRVWVAGELSNLAQPRSGHWYFSLKDRDAQVRCAMFRNANRLVRQAPADGDQVLVRARVGLYEARGDYQLVAEHMEPAGEGALRLAFEQLKARLQAEGLFDDTCKQPVPVRPAHVGVVTSATGAAIRDIQSVMARRSPLTRVTVLPVPVQGDAAAPAIAAAIAMAPRVLGIQALIVGRGGGSLEDLWPFNDEAVARAIADCPVPVVSAVGHETDWSIADWVADVRAPTPSAAAELLTDDLHAWAGAAQRQIAGLERQARHQLRQQQARLASLKQRIDAAHPGRRLEVGAQRLDDLHGRLQRAAQRRNRDAQRALLPLQHRLHGARPARAIRDHQGAVLRLHQRLTQACTRQHQQHAGQLAELAHTLQALSPLATLARGFAIARGPDGAVLRRAQDVQAGDALAVQLGDGTVDATVTGTR